MDQLTSFFSELMVLNLESIAVLFSIVYVILVARENIWCWAACNFFLASFQDKPKLKVAGL